MMRRIAALFLCLMMCAGVAGAEALEERIAIRNGIEPGMELQSVRDAEGIPPEYKEQSDDTYIEDYGMQFVAGLKGQLMYAYGPSKHLYLFGYGFSDDSTEVANEDFAVIDEALRKKYGQPNGTFEDMKKETYDKALSFDKEMLDWLSDASSSVWNLENGYIFHVIKESDLGIDHQLFYYGPWVLANDYAYGI